MAGDKLDEPTKESAEAKEALSQSERNKQIREEIGNDPERLAERISGVDREAYDFDGYTDKQINMAMQGSTFDENDYARLTGKPLGGDKPEPKPETPVVEDDPIDSIPTDPGGSVEPAPTPGPTQGITVPGFNGPNPYGSQQIQNVNQDNDITSSVTGSNNTVTNTQDNSVKQYGGGTKYYGDAPQFANDYIGGLISRFS
jgi:hypothetical protein